ncbi:MAG: carbonate dehydratase [Clostridiales bacterium]|nr:carbonate dehydratase [Clostridiales bacterium]
MNHSDNSDAFLNSSPKIFNINAHFIVPNPKTTFNENSVSPSIDPTSFVGPFSTIIGDVTIRQNVFIAPNVSIRADVGYPFFIDSNTNLQDGVILHGRVNGRIIYGDREYSIYIGRYVTCAQNSLIYGPCEIHDDSYIGFKSIISDALISSGCFISPYVLITGGVTLAPNRFVSVGSVIDTQAKADRLGPVTQEQKDFAQESLNVNKQLSHAYISMYGASVCSNSQQVNPRVIKYSSSI